MKTLFLIALSLLFCVPISHANETTKHGTQLVLLGTAGGPSVKKNRSQPASAVVVNSDICIVDAGEPGFDQAAVWEAAVRKHYLGALIVGEDLMIID